jgi:lipooligosaccharide transport system ATP-binding protein
MGNAIIDAKGLLKRFGKLVAVNRIDFSIVEGECFGFLGPNGAGKTTTVKMIYCASPKTGGRLTVMGKNVDVHPREIKRATGVVQQENNLDPDFTAFENLMVFSRYYSIPEKDAKLRSGELLRFLHLEEKKNTNIDDLSGGMKRRLMIARALLNEPKILVLDEPTTGLDPQARHLIWDQIRLFRERGITVILTTHYMEEAAQLCDRLVIMEGGKIIARGSPAELVAKHGGGGEVLELGAEKKTLYDIIGYLKTRYADANYETEIVGNMLHIFSSDCRALEAELTRKFGIRERVLRMANLEDVFLKLTGRGLRD